MKARRTQKWILTQSERRWILLYALFVLVAVAYAFYLGTHSHPHESVNQDCGVTVHAEGN